VHPSGSSIHIDLESANQTLAAMAPAERITWATQTFGAQLVATTSAGRDAAVLWHALAGTAVPFIFVNTGFLHPDTLTFKGQLVAQFPNVTLIECGPDAGQIALIANQKLWKTDPALFMERTKHAPMEHALKAHNIQAVMSAIHRDQTRNRAGMPFLNRRFDGTYRIHPFLDWSQSQVDTYISEYNLPQNQLSLLKRGISHRQVVYYQGELYIMPIEECGLHVENGHIVRNKSSKRESSPPNP
jgi:phosphoadenosine phosphosulfate reductase